MATALEIANQALLRVGAESITSGEFTTPTQERAIAVSNSWPFVRRAVLRDHAWNCQTLRATITVDGTAPDWDFASRFAIPADCVRVLECNTLAPNQWRVEGAYIVADTTDELEIRYTQDDSDPSGFDAALTEALVIRLAVEIVERVTDSTTKRDLLMAEYRDYLAQAKHLDGQEQSSAEFEEDSWITARW